MERSSLRVAAVQTTAGPDRDRNLERAADLVEEAAAHGAELVVLPEYFSVAGDPSTLRRSAEALDGPTITWATQLARRLEIRLVAGSFPERSPSLGDDPSSSFAADPSSAGVSDSSAGGDPSPALVHNTSCLIGPSGSIEGIYRKIHLFDVTLGDAEVCESASVAAGTEVVVVDPDRSKSAGSPTIGLSLCYDLRFPEMFRIMALRGALVVATPSAFTAATGRAHWELLVRARAVENQVFVLAADQVGTLPPGMPPCHGHTMIVDPWGSIVAERTDPSPGVVVADLDLEHQRTIRRQLPVLANRRPGAYLWPDGDGGVVR
jgi:deaminated glutathione amidase